MTKRKSNIWVALIFIMALCVFLSFGILCTNTSCKEMTNVLTSQVSSENESLTSVSFKSNISGFDELSKNFTNNKLNFDTLTYDNMTSIIPMEIFKTIGTYGYIGREYGFLIDVKSDTITDKNAKILLLEVKNQVNTTTNTVNYSLIPRVDLEASYYDNSTNIIAFKYYGKTLFMGNMVFIPEFNTVNELNTTNDDYRITEDNSMFIDCIVTEHELFESSHGDNLIGAVSYAFNEFLDNQLSKVFKNIPVVDILKAIALDNSKFSLTHGFQYNGHSYQQQIKRGKLQNNASVFMGEKLFLGINKDKESHITFSVKYSNKLHTDENFQFGMKIGFNLFTMNGSSFFSKGEQTYDNYMVYDSYEKNSNSFQIIKHSI